MAFQTTRVQLEPLDAGLLAGAGRDVKTPFSRIGSGHQHDARSELRTAGTVRGNLAATSNLSEADTIKVAVRVRPLFAPEKEKGAIPVVEVAEDHSLIKLVVPGPAGNKMQRDFAFHACLGPDVSQENVLNMCGIPQLLDAALAGYNVTIFAYGQTGSGKTFTMSGHEDVIGTDDYKGGDSNDGITSRAVGYLYQQLQERKDQAKFALSASYLEIYNEGIYDLLNMRSKNLPVKWDAAQGFFVPGLKNVPCGDVHSMMDVIRTGMKHRHVGSHELNIESSRSHSIMTITCCVTPTDPGMSDYGTSRYGKICFVDLAGSERLKDSKSEGVMLKETANINKSLFVLGKVISALAERDSSGTTSSHIPYRDSKLTKLLMDSLGGCAMALMIACCSPSSLHVEETLSTLGYATRAKNIQNRPVIQYDPKEQQIAALRREIDLLRQENMYLREQVRLGGGIPDTPSLMRDSVSDAMALEVVAAAAAANAGESDSGGGGGGGVGVTFGETRVHEVPAWPALVYSPAATPAGGQRSGGQGVGQQGQGLPGQQVGPGGGQQGQGREAMHPPLLRSVSPWRQAIAGSSGGGAAGMQGGMQQGMAAVPGSPRASPNGGSTWSMLEPHSEGAPMALVRSSLVSSSFDGGPGGVGVPLAAAIQAAAAASGAGTGDFNRRLKETQALLARFAEENNRLAKENDRLRVNRTVLGAEHADVLDEIEQLRSKLTGLESAVMTGSFSPADVKALLSGIKQTQQQSPTPPKPGSSFSSPSPHHHGAPSSLHSSFTGALPSPSPSTYAQQYSSGSLLSQQQLPYASPGPAPPSSDPSYGQPMQRTGSQQLWEQQQQGQQQATPPRSPEPDPGRSSSSHSTPPEQQQHAALAPHPPGGAAPARRSPSSSGHMAPTVPSPLPPSHPPAPVAPPKSEVANVMTLGSSTQAAMRTRQGSMGAGGGAAAGGIIVADQSKMALLLGLGGGGGDAAPPVPQQQQQQQQQQYQPPQQQQQQPYMQQQQQQPYLQQQQQQQHGGSRAPSSGGLPLYPGSSHQNHNGFYGPPSMQMQQAPGQQGYYQGGGGGAAGQQTPVQPPAMRPVPVKPSDFANPTKQAQDAQLIRKMMSSGQPQPGVVGPPPVASPGGGWGR